MWEALGPGLLGLCLKMALISEQVKQSVCTEAFRKNYPGTDLSVPELFNRK